jgi:hypothetical protein
VRVSPASGGPSTRFRLDLVAPHRSGRHGRRERDYVAAVRGPQRWACVIESQAWFSHGPPGARLHAVLDPSTAKGQRWCRRRVAGVVRYHDGLCRPGAQCGRVYIRTAGRFRFTVR